MNKLSKFIIATSFVFLLLIMTSCKKTLTITYNANGGLFDNNQGSLVESYKKNTTLTVTTLTPSKPDDLFIGWQYQNKIYKANETFKITSNVEFTAVWANEAGYLTIEYQLENGNFANGSNKIVKEYKKGEKVLLLTDVPTIEGQTFQGWVDKKTGEFVEDSFNINSSLVLVAKYGEPLVEVVYDAVVGKFSDNSTKKTVKVEKNSFFKYIEEPVNNDRLFNGWYNVATDEYISVDDLVTENIEVRAKYKKPGSKARISLNLNGGILDVDKDLTYYEGINYILPVPTKEGFEFVGWYLDDDFTSNRISYIKDTETGEKEYFACWKLVDKNYVRSIFDDLVPSETSEDLFFPTQYQGVSLFFTTSNTSVLTNKGIINPTYKQETVNVECQITLNGEIFTFNKDVIVKAIVFEELSNPVAGYFYNTNITVLTEQTISQLDIVYYAFAQVSSNGGVSVQASAQLKKLMNQALELRKTESMRFVLSIAGGATNFSNACRAIGTSKLADKIIEIVLEYNMDGVDIDWEFPEDATDRERMLNLCEVLRLKLDAISDGTGSKYLVTAAIPSHQSYTKFNLKKLNDVLDYVNMMSYDMNLAGKATHLCPLHRSIYDGGQYGVSLGVEYFTKAGLDKEKIIVGAAFYGKAYKVTGADMWPGQYPALGSSAELYNLQLSSSATVFYKYIYNNILTNNDYKRYYDPKAQVPYLYNEKTKIFITYEDEESLYAKVDYAYENGFGIMFWEYGYDYNNILTDAICKRVEQHKNNSI